MCLWHKKRILVFCKRSYVRNRTCSIDFAVVCPDQIIKKDLSLNIQMFSFRAGWRIIFGTDGPFAKEPYIFLPGPTTHNIAYLNSSILLVVKPTKTPAESQKELVHKTPGSSLICHSSNVMLRVK